jgi:hypothetical protein
MKIETYEDLVARLKSNTLVAHLSDGNYYSDDEDTVRNTEALNIVMEFVMAVPEWQALVQDRFKMWEDDQMCILWMMDDVLTVAVTV